MTRCKTKREQFVCFHDHCNLQELRTAFELESRATGSDRLLLTAAVSAGKLTIDNGYDIEAISRELDFINLMAYDLRGGWMRETGHQSPLYRGNIDVGDHAYLNVDWAVKYWLQVSRFTSNYLTMMNSNL